MWMAPEQINADPLSARTDVWALGLLAFWALTRRVYWKAAYGARVTVQALFAEQLFGELVPARSARRSTAAGSRCRPSSTRGSATASCVMSRPASRTRARRAMPLPACSRPSPPPIRVAMRPCSPRPTPRTRSGRSARRTPGATPPPLRWRAPPPTCSAASTRPTPHRRTSRSACSPPGPTPASPTSRRCPRPSSRAPRRRARAP